jgi:RNA polymerase sigma-70 factor (ECF subfamily)
MSAVPTTLTMRERAMLDAARKGDEHAYRGLVEPLRGPLHAHCYRMLGSVHDAEDALQDALLRAWRALPRFEGRSSLRSWLYKIATNTCLNLIARRPKRVLAAEHGPAADPHDGPGAPLVESVWVEPYPDERLADAAVAAPDARYEERESVELAFVAALQHLPARQRAVLILREVLGFSASEVADVLDTSVPSINSALQRARKAIDERRPAQSQQATLRALGDERLRDLVQRYVEAWEGGDVDAIVAMLAEDATLAMPPMATWYRGRGAVAVFLSDWAFAQRWDTERFVPGDRRVRLVPVNANGQVAFAAYRWDPEQGEHVPMALQVLTLDGERIADITGFVTPEVFRHFGLPDVLPRSWPDGGSPESAPGH